jgi:multiple sugar transport system substrate-binding protein
MDRRLFLRGAGLGVAAAALPASSLLAACGSDDASSGGKFTLDFPTWQAEEAGVKDWWKLAVQNFQTANPNITVNMQAVPFASYTDTLTSRFSAGKPPEIVHLPTTSFGAFASQGWLADLDDRLKGTDILANWTQVQKTMLWDGHNAGVLILGYAPVLYYNEQLLGDAGVEVPTTMDALLAALPKLTSNGLYGVGLTTKSDPGIYNDATWWVYGAGSAWSRGSTLAFTDSATVAAMDQYRQAARFAPKGVVATQKRTLHGDGKIAMIIDGPFVLSSLKQTKTAATPHLKTAKAPFRQQPGFPSSSIHIPADLDDDKADAVWNFIKSLTTPEMQTKYAQLYTVPAPRKGAVTPQLIQSIPELGLFQQTTDSAVNATPDSQDLVANFTEVQKLIVNACVRLQTTNDATSSVMGGLQDQVAKAIKS